MGRLYCESPRIWARTLLCSILAGDVPCLTGSPAELVASLFYHAGAALDSCARFTVRDLSAFLRRYVVAPLDEMGVPIDLHDVQLVMVLLPVALVVAAFMRASWKKRQRMKDAGM
jgi:hypothetical protein